MKGNLKMTANPLTEILNNLVSQNDILPVRVSTENMNKGKKDRPNGCPGVLAILDELQRLSGLLDMRGVRIAVGHKTKEHFSDRVVIKVDAEPNYKWVGWIQISETKSGFHPQKFDQGKQKLPGAMMLEGWSKEHVEIMPEEIKEKLTSEEYRLMNIRHRESLLKNGNHRIYNQ